MAVSRPLRLSLAKLKYEKAVDEIELAWLSFNNPLESDPPGDFYIRQHQQIMRDISLDRLRLNIKGYEEQINHLERRIEREEVRMLVEHNKQKKDREESLARLKEHLQTLISKD